MINQKLPELQDKSWTTTKSLHKTIPVCKNPALTCAFGTGLTCQVHLLRRVFFWISQTFSNKIWTTWRSQSFSCLHRLSQNMQNWNWNDCNEQRGSINNATCSSSRVLISKKTQHQIHLAYIYPHSFANLVLGCFDAIDWEIEIAVLTQCGLYKYMYGCAVV